MVGKILLLIFILLSLIIESTLIPFPFVLTLSLLYLFFYDDIGGVLFIFVVTILLDMFTISNIGITGLLVFGTILAGIAVEKIFSFQGFVPYAAVVLMSVFLYGFMMDYPFSFVMSVILFVLLGVLAFIERRINKKGGLLYEKV